MRGQEFFAGILSVTFRDTTKMSGSPVDAFGEKNGRIWVSMISMALNTLPDPLRWISCLTIVSFHLYSQRVQAQAHDLISVTHFTDGHHNPES